MKNIAYFGHFIKFSLEREKLRTGSVHGVGCTIETSGRSVVIDTVRQKTPVRLLLSYTGLTACEAFYYRVSVFWLNFQKLNSGCHFMRCRSQNTLFSYIVMRTLASFYLQIALSV